MNDKLKLAIVDDHRLFREGLKFLLANSQLFGHIFEASTATEFLKMVSVWQADVVLMDIDMPEINGIDATKQYLVQYPEARVIALSMHANEDFYSDMIDAGAKGFLLKDSTFDEVLEAIKEVHHGGNYFSPGILSVIIKNLKRKKSIRKNKELSDRETEVLYNICLGLSNQEIAEQLFISKRTVDKHRENILLKTGLHNTAELVVYAIKHSIFEV